jgi:hypothetical protein
LDYLSLVGQKRTARSEQIKGDSDKAESTSQAQDGVQAVVQAVRQEHAKDRTTKQTVEVANPVTSVETPDVQQVVQAVQQLAADIKSAQLDLSPIRSDLSGLQGALEALPAQMPKVPKAERIDSLKVSNLGEVGSLITALSKQVDGVISAVNALELSPAITVTPADVAVAPLDLDPVLSKLDAVVKALAKPVKEPTPLDLSPLIESVGRVDSAIKNLRFPIPNYLLPFKDIDGKATQVTLTADGKLAVEASVAPPEGGATEEAQDEQTAVLTDILEAVEASGGTATATLAVTSSLTASGTVLTPTSGKKLRLTNLKFSLSADMTDIAFRFTSGGTNFEKYLTPKAGGLYGISLPSGQYIQGGTDEVLHCVITGTGTVQFNIKYTEAT